MDPIGSTQTISLLVNRIEHQVQIEARVSLLDVLRETIGLTGAKKGCDQGACGACTVLVNGVRINACLTLAMQCEGMAVVTVEGLADQAGLHPLQSAFIRYDGLQCGYCTPGQLCSAIGMFDEVRKGMPSAVGDAFAALTELEIKERMSGNLCRCGAYGGIAAAIAAVSAQEMADAGAGSTA